MPLFFFVSLNLCSQQSCFGGGKFRFSQSAGLLQLRELRELRHEIIRGRGRRDRRGGRNGRGGRGLLRR